MTAIVCPFRNCRAHVPVPGDRTVYVHCAWNGRTYSVTADGECEIAPWEVVEKPRRWGRAPHGDEQ